MNDAALIKANGDRWIVAKATRDFTGVARRLVAQKDRYLKLQQDTTVPWFVIAVIHEREASQDFSKNIAQGDPWDRPSTHVPKGRGPFNSFEAAARDALINCPPFAAKWKDWSAGGALTLLEKYNGLGYANRGLPSPYIWSGTDQYLKGKYIADGVFDPEAIDAQLGCAGLIMAMRKLDPSIKFSNEKPALPVPQAKHAVGIAAILAAIGAALKQNSTAVAIAIIIAGITIALLLHFLGPKKGG